MERRTVSILFCDVKGFTTFSERLDPEEITDIMNEAFEVIVAPVNRFGGMVARLMGDGMLAFFGAPHAHEDDPERAVRAGLEIVSEVAEFAGRLAQDRDVRGFSVRVGINTGEVVVGEVGAQTDAEYTAMGDAVNVAARLETAAEPGTILISAATYRQIAHAFEVRELGALAVKGREQPVETYQVLAARDLTPRPRGIPGLSSAIVGRQLELDALTAALDRLRSGVGGIVTITGDAGIGKSRLIAEARASTPDIHWVEGRCLSYGGATAYHLWLDLLHEMLGLADNASYDEARRILHEQIQNFVPDPEDALYRGLARVLVSEDDAAGSPGEQVRRETFAAMEALLEAVADQKPTAVVCEDLHWADPTSLDLLEEAFALTDRAPILFICAYRPDPQHGVWRIRETAARAYPHRHVDIPLKPLTAFESETLARNLLGRVSALDQNAGALPERLVWRILSHSEGNPFYVEEVIRSLIESGAISPMPGGGWQINRDIEEIAIPDTLKGVLAARIDRLPRAGRRVLQLAAVIGRTFSRRVLGAIIEDHASLDDHLLTLQRDEMIREQARLPEVEYIFKHQLTQEVAYDGLLRRERTAYHRRVAEALERLYADRLDERIEQLAYHWERAGDLERACDYLIQAGARARRIGASLEAIEFYAEALERSARLPVESPCLPAHLIHELLGDIHLENLGQRANALEHYAAFVSGAAGEEAARGARKVAGVHLTHGALEDAEQHYDIALKYLAESPASVEASRVHFGLSYLDMSRNRIPDALRHAEAALKISEALEDTRGMADAYKMLGHVAGYQGDLSSSTEYSARSLALYRELGDLARIPIACNNLADSLRQEGRLDRALSEMEEGLRVARQIGNSRDEALLLITTGEVLIDQGRGAAAIPLLEQALALSRSSGVMARIIPAQHALGVACRDAGRLNDARGHLEIAATTALENRHERYLPWIHLDLARLETLDEDFDAAARQIATAQTAAGASPSEAFAALAEICDAGIQLAQQEWDPVITRLEPCLGYLETAGYKINAARARLALGRAYAGRNSPGDQQLARHYFRDAADAFQAFGALACVARARSEMEKLPEQP